MNQPGYLFPLALFPLAACLAGSPALAEPGSMLGTANATAPVGVECWQNHVQVQASPPRENPLGAVTMTGALSGDAGAERRLRAPAERHVGTEHPSQAGLRPCSSLPPTSPATEGKPQSR